MDIIFTLLAFIVTIGVLVTVHEAGHFIAARLMGVHVIRFSVGFGHPLLKWVDRRGTEWVVAALPLGGYVRMFDERVDAATAVLEGPAPAADSLPDPADYAHNRKSPPARIFIAAAGPLANFLLAIVVFWCMYMVGVTGSLPWVGAVAADAPAGRAGLPAQIEIVSVDGHRTGTWQAVHSRLLDRLGESGSIELGWREHVRFDGDGDGDALAAAGLGTTRVRIEDWLAGVKDPAPIDALGLTASLPAVVAEVVSGSPADRAGMRAGDRVVAVDGAPIEDWYGWVDAVRAAPGQPLEVAVDGAEGQRRLLLVPESIPQADGGFMGRAGVRSVVSVDRRGPVEAIGAAVRETGARTGQLLGMLGKMVVGMVSVENLSGPVSIARVAGDSARIGPGFYLGVLGALSISLGLLNLLPIPILDGGHILFFGIEWLRGEPLPERVQVIGIQAGMMLLMGVMFLALYNDLMRL